MSDYSELKRLAEAAKSSSGGNWYTSDQLAFRAIDSDESKFVAEATPETVLALIAENEALREANDKLSRRNGMLEGNVQAMTETHVLYTWLRKKCDQPSNDVVAVQMNIGHDWVPVHDLDQDLRAMIDREKP